MSVLDPRSNHPSADERGSIQGIHNERLKSGLYSTCVSDRFFLMHTEAGSKLNSLR
jgi:hypothetical protein